MEPFLRAFWEEELSETTAAGTMWRDLVKVAACSRYSMEPESEEIYTVLNKGLSVLLRAVK